MTGPIRGGSRAAPAGARERKAAKRATNLTLDPDAVARGERFGRRHGTSLSQLVNGFLHALPSLEDDAELAELTAPARRLYGIAASGEEDERAHRAHLVAKYGGDGG